MKTTPLGVQTINAWESIFTFNIISNNSFTGFILDGGINYDNYVANNSISGNGYGLVAINSAYNNTIEMNNFFDNPGGISQAVDNGTTNKFNDNYWNEWTSPDNNNDGVVDSPYQIEGTANNTDQTPQTNSYSLFSVPQAPVITIFPSDLSFETGSTGKSLSWTVTDENPDNYTIYSNNQVIKSGTWQSGVTIVHNLDTDILTPGNYNYTL